MLKNSWGQGKDVVVANCVLAGGRPEGAVPQSEHDCRAKDLKTALVAKLQFGFWFVVLSIIAIWVGWSAGVCVCDGGVLIWIDASDTPPHTHPCSITPTNIYKPTADSVTVRRVAGIFMKSWICSVDLFASRFQIEFNISPRFQTK